MDRLIESIVAPDTSVPEISLRELVENAIAELRPRLKRDGGDIELVSVDGDLVVVDLTGQCQGCVLASVTIAGIRKRLIDAIGRPLRVVPKSAFTAVSALQPRPVTA